MLAGISDSGQSACFCTLGTVYKKKTKKVYKKTFGPAVVCGIKDARDPPKQRTEPGLSHHSVHGWKPTPTPDTPREKRPALQPAVRE